MTKDHDDLSAAVTRLLEPLAGLLLHHGVPHAAFAEWAKFAFIQAAEAQGGVAGRKVSASRLSIVTGLTRKDVARIRATSAPRAAEESARNHRAARVVNGWTTDAAYQDGDGEPLVLPFDAGEPSFSSLVRQFGGDVPPRAVLDELARVGTVEVSDADRATLKERAYVPRRSEAQILDVLATDVGGLIDTIGHNLEEPDDPKFQRRVYYDNVPEEALSEIKALASKHGQALLEKLNTLMAKHDRDSDPTIQGTGRKMAGIGVYYFDDDYDDGSSEESR